MTFPSSDRAAGYFTIYSYSTDISNHYSAHDHEIEVLEMDYSGKLVASASKKGTIIRVFKIRDGKVLQEFRRGIDNAKIMSLCFDVLGSMLALSSDSGTIHVYAVNNDELSMGENNSLLGGTSSEAIQKKAKMGFFKKAMQYFDKESSFCQLKVDEKIVFVNFNYEGSEVFVYKASGKFWRFEFPKEIEKMKKKIDLTDFKRILKQ
jgi:WD40 repeat protein